jgi:hypothetical protein
MLTKRNSLRMITACCPVIHVVKTLISKKAVNKDWHDVVFTVLTLVILKNVMFWKMTPCGLVANSTTRAFTLLTACLAYPLTLKMEVVRSAETLANLYQSIRRYVPGSSSHQALSRHCKHKFPINAVL